MRYHFRLRARPFLKVCVELDEDLPLLTEALADSLTTVPPLGVPQVGPSTFRLDKAISNLRQQMVTGGTEPIASGNYTYLAHRAGKVEAMYDLGDELEYGNPGDRDAIDVVSADEFLALLLEWRGEVLRLSPKADQRVPRGGSDEPTSV